MAIPIVEPNKSDLTEQLKILKNSLNLSLLFNFPLPSTWNTRGISMTSVMRQNSSTKKNQKFRATEAIREKEIKLLVTGR